MSIVGIPVRSDIPCYDYQINLEGSVYTLSFCYNDRNGFWYMDIADQNGTLILSGIKLVGGVLLNSQYPNISLPPGDFFIYDSTSKNTDPSKYTLGKVHKLFYRESTT